MVQSPLSVLIHYLEPVNYVTLIGGVCHKQLQSRRITYIRNFDMHGFGSAHLVVAIVANS